MKTKEQLIGLIKSASKHIGMCEGIYDYVIIKDIQSYIDELNNNG